MANSIQPRYCEQTMKRELTYGGWTATQIREAEDEGDHIPVEVLIHYLNGDSDQANY